MKKRIGSLLLAFAMVLGMAFLVELPTVVAATTAEGTTGPTVFAKYGTPVIDGKVDGDSTLYNWNTIWLMNGKIGGAPFGVMWDHDHLYLAIDTESAGAVTVNGVEVTTVDGAVREAEIALDTLGIHITDYNDTAALSITMGDAAFEGVVSFAKDTSMFFDIPKPQIAKTAGYCLTATATADRSSDCSILTYGLAAGPESHAGWTTHSVYSQKTITRGMPAVDANGAVTSDDIHVMEFDFGPTNLPAYASASKGFWHDKFDYHPVNGFNMLVQYDKTTVKSTAKDDGGSGHAYAIGITNIDGVLTLAVRTPSVNGSDTATLYPIAAAGQWSAADMYRIRLEYDFSTGMLDIWADGKYLGRVDPMALSVTGTASNTVRMELFSMNKAGTWTDDCPTMSFVVANAHSGMKENDSVLDESGLMDALDVSDILGSNTDASAISADLSLPKYLSHEIFNGIALDWSSSNADAISNDGKVTVGDVENTVSMTATVIGTERSKTLGELIIPSVPTVDNAMVKTQQLYLGGDLRMDFALEVDPALVDETSVEITVNGRTETKAIGDITPEEDGTYKIPVNLDATQMTDDILVKVLGPEGTLVEKTYSIRAYAEYILEGDYPDNTKQLVRAMLNYGAAAQVYFKHNTDDLANKGYENTETADIPKVNDLDIAGEVEGIKPCGASLVLKSKVVTRFYFEVSGDINDYTFSTGKQPVYEDGSGLYYVEAPGVSPQKYADVISLKVTDGASEATIRYSPLTYIYRKYHLSSSETLKDLLVFMYQYYLAALLVA